MPEIVKIPKSNYAYAFHISEQLPIEQYLNELEWVKALTKTKRYLERLEFHYSSGTRIAWPLQRILDQDYHVLKTVYIKLDSKNSFGQGIRSEIPRKIGEIRKNRNESSELPLKLSLPDTSSSIYNQPSRLMTFRDDQGIKRFFVLRDHARSVDIDTLRAMQKKLNGKITEEALFIEDLHRKINKKMARQQKK